MSAGEGEGENALGAAVKGGKSPSSRRGLRASQKKQGLKDQEEKRGDGSR